MAPKGDNVDILAQEWQLGCEGLRERAGIVLRTEQWTDCSFLVGSEGPRELKAHKLMLAMASPVFEAMFYGPLAEKGHAIRVPDIEPDVFNAMLEFIYTDNYEINSGILAIDIYYGAQKYMLPKLQKFCCMYLSSNLTPEIVCRVYEFSHKVDETGLSGDCKKVIASKTENVLKSSGFLDLNIDTVVEIFSWDELAISSELVLIQAAQHYNQVNQARSQDAGHKATVHMNMQQTMKREKGGDNGHCSQSDSGENVDDVNPANSGAGDMGHASQIKSKNGDSDDIEWLFKIEVEDVETKIETKRKEEVVVDREILRVLRQIRFLSLTPEQIAVEKSLLSLLTNSEMLAIIVNLNAQTSQAVLPLPKGFSADKRKRAQKQCRSCSCKNSRSSWGRSNRCPSCRRADTNYYSVA